MADNSDSAQVDSAVELIEDPADVELVTRVIAGDESAFEELFNRHRRRVALIGGRFFRQREQIEEVVQETFSKAYFALADFSNRQESSFAAWIARIAFNVCYDELRRLKRRPESTFSDMSHEDAGWLRDHASTESGGKNVESATISRDMADKLLARLSPEDQLVLVMIDAEGLSVSEIAQSTGWSVSKVKVRAHRARARLRGVLARFL